MVFHRATSLLMLSLLFCAETSASDGVFPYAVQEKTLPNGLKVYAVAMPSGGLVTYFTVVRAGSRDEVEPGRSGYAHFFEHMMFRGTKRRPGAEYLRLVGELGARANAFTSDDLTAYHLTFHRDDLEKVVDLESDRFQNLDYDLTAFQTEAGAILGEYRIGAANPWFALHEKMQDLAYDVHPYKHTTIGFEADVRAMPEGYDYSREFYRRFYRPENTVILAVGEVDPAEVFALAEKYYGAWPPGYEAPCIASEPPQDAPRRTEIAFRGQTLPILAIGYKGDAFDPDNPDYVAARLLAQLAFGRQSELYKKLVLRDQIVESLQCDVPINRDRPLFDIVAVVKNAADIPIVRESIDRTIEELQSRPVDVEKLDDLKRRNRYGFVMELDTTDKTATALARFIAAAGDIGSVDRLFAASERITPQDIRRAAAKYFIPQRRTEVVLTGISEQGPSSSPPSKQAKRAESDKNNDDSRNLKSPNPKSPNPQIPKSPLPKSSFVLLPDADDPSVCFRIWFRVGSRDDPPGKEGLAAATAAMLSEGATRENSYEQILDKLFPLAAEYTATASVEMTIFSGRVHRDNLDRFYPLLLEALEKPAFRQEDLARIKSQTLNYLENTLPHCGDEELGKAALYNAIFAGTRYGHLPEGTVEGVRAITLDDVEQFYRTHYCRKQNICVGLAGGFGPELVERLRRDLAPMAIDSDAPTGDDRPPPAPKPIHGLHVTLVEKPCDATAISAGYPIGALRGRPDWYALAVANSWLGQHRNLNGRLFQSIREARGLNYGNYSYIEHFPNGSRLLMPPTGVARQRQIFELWIRPVPPSAAHFALRAALWELKSLADHGLSEAEFEKTRDFLRKYIAHLAPTTMDRLGYALDDRFFGIEGSHLEQFRRRLDSMTRDEVNAAIQKHLQYENMHVVMVAGDAERLKQALVADAPSPISYATPKLERIMAEDRQISVFPLKIRAENVHIVPAAELFVK